MVASPRKASFIALVVWRNMAKERKKKSKEKYELERRALELEEQLLDIQQRRLDLEQKRVELQLKKVRLATRKPRRHQSTPPSVIGPEETSLQPPSDDESSLETAPTVSTQNEYPYSDASAEPTRQRSQRFSGGESDGEEAMCPPKADTRRRRFSEAKRSSSRGAASAKSEPMEPTQTRVAPSSMCQRSSSDTLNGRDRKNNSAVAKRGTQSMRELGSRLKPSLDNVDRSTSLRNLLTDTHAQAFAMLHDISVDSSSCNRSDKTIDSSKTKVTSNVSDHKKDLERGRSYPSFSDDPNSQHGDLQNGEFVYEWDDGRRYEGSWKDGKVRSVLSGL